eukprot:7090966-Prymnesium_polylepis.3
MQLRYPRTTVATHLSPIVDLLIAARFTCSPVRIPWPFGAAQPPMPTLAGPCRSHPTAAR